MQNLQSAKTRVLASRHPPEKLMYMRTFLAVLLAAVSLAAMPGCAVTRGQESVGAYIDDAAITTAVKARLVDNQQVDAAAISVETLNGTVMLSGFAKSTTERSTAESLAMKVDGVRSVKNSVAVRP
jgi:hyperosmotically inducible protein